jgi:glutamine synthetase type III
VRVARGDEGYAPGQVIVAFEEQEETVLQTTQGITTSIYEELNSVFEEYGLINERPLFRAASLVTNVYVLQFPMETNLDELVADMAQLSCVKEVTKNPELDESILDYIP